MCRHFFLDPHATSYLTFVAVMEKFTVSKLASFAGISVRTLHHYDEIGLLKPLARSDTRYRYYGSAELLKLQQIMLYREMGLPLARIAEIVNDPDFDALAALKAHKKELSKRQEQLKVLLHTVDRTIKQLTSKTKIMNFEEMYKGFSREQAEAYRKEAADRWGEATVADSENRVRKMGKAEFEKLKQQGDRIYRDLVALKNVSPDDDRVQALVSEHFEMTGRYFDVTPAIYRSLGEMYVNDERFRATFDRYDRDLAPLLKEAIAVFVRARA